MGKRNRYAIGEILGAAHGWPSSYWFVKAHGRDNTKYGTVKSVEVIEHWPTGVVKSALVSTLRRGNLPHLKLAHKKNDLAAAYKSVCGHRQYIFNPRRKHNTYAGMPFQDEWNADKRGSSLRAAWEITQDIGPKPGPNYHLSVIVWKKGFVRGNLKWEVQPLNTLEAHLRKAVSFVKSKEQAKSLVDLLQTALNDLKTTAL
jgi:hypothetical protein